MENKSSDSEVDTIKMEPKTTLKARDPLQHTSMYQRNEEDSEDSDGEGGLGNVSRAVIRPVGHSGKAKRGHLCFDAAFETGNLGRVDLVAEFEYDLYVRPDTCSPRFRFWFNFTVDNVRQDQRVIFNIVNISNRKNLFRDGMTPLVKSTSRPKWQRIPPGSVFYSGKTAVSLAFAFDKEDEMFQFAAGPPYSYSRYLGSLELKAPPDIMKRTCIAKSVQNRDVDMIEIGENKALSSDQKQRVVVVLARTHAGESPSSFVVQGMLEFLISTHPIARCIRDNIKFIIIPMMNPDGVFLGNQRTNLIGLDLNRTWHTAGRFTHPSTYAVTEMLKNIENENTKLDFVLDLHAHPGRLGTFVYGNAYEDVYRFERHLVFAKCGRRKMADYAAENTMYNAGDSHKQGTARRFLCSILPDHVNIYTVHVSMYGFKPEGFKKPIPYTEEDWLMPSLKDTILDVANAKNQRKSRSRRKISSRREKSEMLSPKAPRSQAPLHKHNLLDMLINTSQSSDEPLSPTRMQSQAWSSDKRLIKSFKRTTTCAGTNNNMLGGLHSSTKTDLINATQECKSAKQIININAKPTLSVINVNQLTKGGLDKARKRIS
ncbi:cytosolic carboxypeptidase 6-like [Ctenocephalides felis]|uniref:cytosolic carboxypeptidase 6-like n=1 Tax=Ctenocephalides felis TaxID=7515 RepID=UPI000E6E4848|nr:cytosolic carboxypeptidase 6-like [Ctenocephalides felis]